MAYQVGNRGNNRPQAPSQGNDSWEKAAGFINLYLPKPDGGRRKLGSIPLKLSNVFEAALVERLSKDPEAIQALLAALEIDFRAIDQEQDPSKVDLGF